MGIAEQMGRVLQRTSISVNIKERLDFSCALFDPEGRLVSNAPHLPVHLGAMSEAVRFQIGYYAPDGEGCRLHGPLEVRGVLLCFRWGRGPVRKEWPGGPAPLFMAGCGAGPWCAPCLGPLIPPPLNPASLHRRATW